MVWYRRRSLETTVKIKLKTRSRRLKSKSWEHQRTAWLQGTLIDWSSSNASIPTLKPSTTQGPTSSRARHTTQILQQHRKHSPELQYTGSPKSLQTHWHFITHYWTLIWTSERRNTDPHPRTPTQASLTWKPWQATVQPHPQQGNSTIKITPQTTRIQKGHPKCSNINRMKRQRNTQQVKEQDKCPPNQTKRKR